MDYNIISMDRQYKAKRLQSLGRTQRFDTARRLLNNIKSNNTKEDMDEIKDFVKKNSYPI